MLCSSWDPHTALTLLQTLQLIAILQCDWKSTGDEAKSPASHTLRANKLPVCTHPFLVAQPEFQHIYLEGQLPNICRLSLLFISRHENTYRVGGPFTVIGKLEPLCVRGLIHLLTLVILDLKTQKWSASVSWNLHHIFTHALIRITKYLSEFLSLDKIIEEDIFVVYGGNLIQQ